MGASLGDRRAIRAAGHAARVYRVLMDPTMHGAATTPAAPTTAPSTPAADLAARWDAITVEQLRAQGSTKWTTFPRDIGMFIAEMDFGIADEIRDALEPALHTGALGYLPGADRAVLRAATARYQREEFGWEVDPTQVHILPDVMSAMSATIVHLTPPGAPVVVPTPCYMPFLDWPASHDRELLTIPSPEAGGCYELPIAALDAALARTGPGALVVLCNPWNPVGRVLEREELLALADVVDRRGAFVFADEIHAPLVLDEAARHIPYASLDERTANHTATAVAASKGWNIPGLKCGQLILQGASANATLGAYVTRLGDNVGLLGARAATVAYGPARHWNEAARDYLRGNRDLLAAAVAEGRLPGVRIAPIEGTYIAWLDLRATRFADAPAGTLGEAIRDASGVALTDGALCGEPGFARMILATPRPILRRAIAAFGDALA